jgi:tRNA 2-thiouridine synthesizing protein A
MHEFDVAADLGDAGCGDLAIELMRAIKPLRAGQVLQVRALDPGARADIPAWCKMRGHALVYSEREFYYIQKGEK